jgi:LysR family glycine cleavage system transcriptional activator
MTARLPSLNGLRAFEAAARHLSFTNAASELNVTQTAISHQIRRLEEELGIRLFVRQNRALALTPEARHPRRVQRSQARHRPAAAQGQ